MGHAQLLSQSVNIKSHTIITSLHHFFIFCLVRNQSDLKCFKLLVYSIYKANHYVWSLLYNPSLWTFDTNENLQKETKKKKIYETAILLFCSSELSTKWINNKIQAVLQQTGFCILINTTVHGLWRHRHRRLILCSWGALPTLVFMRIKLHELYYWEMKVQVTGAHPANMFWAKKKQKKTPKYVTKLSPSLTW